MPETPPTPEELTERYGSVFNCMIEGVQIIDFDHRYLFVNNAAVVQNKFPREQLIGFTQTEKYPGLEKTEVYAKISECAEQRKPTSIENQFEFPDGTKGWYEVRSEPLPYGVLILSLDITDRKNKEEALQKEMIEVNVATGRAKDAEKLNKIVIDRELAMIELKEKVKKLEAELKELRASVTTSSEPSSPEIQ